MSRFKLSRVPLAVCLVTQALMASVLAHDWPQWRGPQRTAISTETGLQQDWPAGGPKLAWKTRGVGAGHGSVTVAGGKIFLLGDDGDSSFVFALKEKGGEKLWSTKIGRAGAEGWADAPGPRSTPTVSGGHVFVLGQYGELVCLGANDGQEKWRREYTSDFGGSMPGWGYSESVLVDGDHVIATPGGSRGAVVALEKKSGKEAWRCKEFTDPAHYSSPIAVEIDGVRQFIVLTERSVAGIAAKDGKLLWRAARKGATAVIPTPVFNDNHIYVTSGYGVGCHLFTISKDASGFKSGEVYANKTMVNHHGGVVLIGEHVYGYSDGKGWTAQEFKSGKVAWQEKARLGKGSIVFADGRLYCRAEDKGGVVALLAASPAGYREHGRFAPPERSGRPAWAHPVVAHGKLYIRDQDLLLCYDVKQ